MNQHEEKGIIGSDKPKIRDLSIVKVCKFCQRLYHPLISKGESNQMAKGYCTPKCFRAAQRAKEPRRHKEK